MDTNGSATFGAAPLDVSAVPRLVAERYHIDRLRIDRVAESTASLLRLDGQRALVTGGGGDGLGNATCHRLAEQGAAVAVLDINLDAAQATVDQLVARWGIDATAVAADVGDWDAVRRAVEHAADRLGGLEILVNNAGGSGAIGPDGNKLQHRSELLDMEVEQIGNVVRVNLLGVLLASKAALQIMVPQRRGRIINIASEVGIVPAAGTMVYGAAKSGVIFFTKSLAREVGKHGVSCVAVCPGIMVVQRTLDALATGNGTVGLDSMIDRVTLGRCSVPDEVASVISFLASPAGSYVHGTSVSVGGGMADS